MTFGAAISNLIPSSIGNIFNSSNASSHPITVPLTEAPTVEQAPAQNGQTAAASTNTKRPREGSGQEQGRTGKRVHLNKNEVHLVEHSRPVPDDALTFTVPSSREHNPTADWHGHSSNRSSQSAMAPSRGFKPINTLGNSTKQAATQNGVYSSSAPGKQSQNTQLPPQRPPRPLPLHGADTNVPIKRSLEGPVEQYVGREESKAKRQKPNGTTIDLTDEDDAAATPRNPDPIFGTTLGRADKTARTAQNDQGLNHRLDRQAHEELFASSSFKNHLKRAGPAGSQSNTTERTLDDTGSMRSASQSSRNGAVKGANVSKKRPSVESLPSQQTRERRNEQTSTRPAINLTNGWDDLGFENRNSITKPKQGTLSDLQATNQIMNSAKKKSQKQPPTKLRANMQAAAVQNQTSANHFAPISTSKDDTEPLRHRFKRTSSQKDDSPHQTPDRSSKQVELSEEDELVGPATIHSSHTSSPAKNEHVAGSQHRHRSSRHSSPSDIRPTRFKTSGVTKPQAAKQLQSSEPAEPDFIERIPVSAMFSQAFASNQKGIELVWDNRARSYHIECNNTAYRSPIDGKIVRIGERDVRSGWTYSKRALKAHLKGSASQHNTGHILLEFFRSDDMSECFDHLHYSTHGKGIQNGISELDMENLFAHQKKQLLDAHQRYGKRLNTNINRVAPGVSLWDRSRDAAVAEEHIKYDYGSDDEPVNRGSKLRSSMQGRDTMADAMLDDDHQEPRQRLSHVPDARSRYFPAEGIRKSARQPKPVKTRSPSPAPPPKWTQIHNPKRWRQSVVYPPEGLRRVTVDFDDLGKLDEGEFLNDNIVNFELRFIEEHMSTEHRGKVHFFNTYFFSSLSWKNGKKAFNYEAVSRWTKKIDIFSIPYIVVPVNVDLHWFVVIICNMPNLKRKAPILVEEDAANDLEVGDKMEGVEGLSSDDPPEQPDTNKKPAKEPDNGNEIFQFDENGQAGQAEIDRADSSAISRPSSTTGKKLKKKPAQKKYDPEEPILITMDSFGMARGTELRYLKQYLCAEADSRRGMSLEPGDLQGMTAKGLPEQPDFHNCGVYLIGYISEFAKNPDKFVRQVLQREIDQNNGFADFDPSAKRDEIRDRLLSLQQQQEAQYKARKQAKAAAKKGQTAPSASSTEQTAPAPANAAPRASSATAPLGDEKSASSPAKDNHPARTVSVADITREKVPPEPEGEDSLQVSPPRAQQQARRIGNNQLVSSAPTARPASDSDEEMLDVPDSADAPAATSSQPAQGIFDQGLPYQSSAQDVDLLAGLEQHLSTESKDHKSVQSVSSDGPDDGGNAEQRDNLINAMQLNQNEEPIVLDLDDEDGDHVVVEIPDSQEQATTKMMKGRHTYFMDD